MRLLGAISARTKCGNSTDRDKQSHWLQCFVRLIFIFGLTERILTEDSLSHKIRHRVGKPFKFLLRDRIILLVCHILTIPSTAEVIHYMSQVDC